MKNILLATMATVVLGCNNQILACDLEENKGALPSLWSEPLRPTLESSTKTIQYRFTGEGNAPMFPFPMTGFSFPEAGHRWTDGYQATISIPCSDDVHIQTIVFKGTFGFASPEYKQILRVTGTGDEPIVYPYSGDKQDIEIHLPTLRQKEVKIIFDLPNACRPSTLDPNNSDPRVVGVAFNSVDITAKKYNMPLIQGLILEKGQNIIKSNEIISAQPTAYLNGKFYFSLQSSSNLFDASDVYGLIELSQDHPDKIKISKFELTGKLFDEEDKEEVFNPWMEEQLIKSIESSDLAKRDRELRNNKDGARPIHNFENYGVYKLLGFIHLTLPTITPELNVASRSKDVFSEESAFLWRHSDEIEPMTIELKGQNDWGNHMMYVRYPYGDRVSGKLGLMTQLAFKINKSPFMLKQALTPSR